MTRRPLIAEVFVRVLYPMMLVGSLWIVLRGHNAPGGGFIGGLVAVAATSAWALVFGCASAERRLPLRPVALAACGVLAAMFSGAMALYGDLPFLTHMWRSFDFGLLTFPVSTVMLFDFGVYLCVWGSLSGFCLELIHPVGGQA